MLGGKFINVTEICGIRKNERHYQHYSLSSILNPPTFPPLKYYIRGEGVCFSRPNITYFVSSPPLQWADNKFHWMAVLFILLWSKNIRLKLIQRLRLKYLPIPLQSIPYFYITFQLFLFYSFFVCSVFFFFFAFSSLFFFGWLSKKLYIH